MLQEVIRYLIKFLSGIDCYNKWNGIAYTDDMSNISDECKVIIVPSGFFKEGYYGTAKTLPNLPLENLKGIPILYGKPQISYLNGRTILHADLIASSFFLLTRYEELIKPYARDQFDCFSAKSSMPYLASFIDRPIVDEYGIIIRDIMRQSGIDVNEPPKEFSKIFLTHDIDCPWEHFTAAGAMKRILGILKREKRFSIYPIKNLFGNVQSDPWYTFPWLMEQDKKVRDRYGSKCRIIYFMKSGGNSKPEDYDIYINTKACKKLYKQLRNSRAHIGLHISYEAGGDTKLIRNEYNKLKALVGEKLHYNRNHYLRSRYPRDMKELIKLGITDDFTMGYNEVAGFRLGTSRSVNWIDPETMEITALILHPLTIMEGSLTASPNMNLNEKEALCYANNLINSVKNHNGELILLWHNNSVVPGTAKGNRQLYETIINNLIR